MQNTLANQQRLEHYLRQVGGALPPEEFCKVVSDYYHEIESPYYDAVHAEIFEEETVMAWHAVLGATESHLPKRLRVLDVGCGTGFAAQTVLQTLGPERVGTLVCIDPAKHMLNLCEKKLAGFAVDKRFHHTDIGGLREESHFDLIVTNSVLHHVFDLGTFFRELDRLLAVGGIYTCGHEPSARHYQIEEVGLCNRRFRGYMRFRRGLRIKRVTKRLLSSFGLIPLSPTLADKVNRRLAENHYIKLPLAGNAIQKMVDIHVPQSTGEYLWGEPGFSPECLVSKYLPNYSIAFTATYHHIKAPRHLLGFYWLNVNDRLKARHPDGGADIIMAFRKPS